MSEKNLKVSTLLDYYGELLTDKQRDLAQLYYNEDLSLGEISELEHISRQGVRDSIKRGEAFLFELEDKLHMASTMTTLSKVLEEISLLAEQSLSHSTGEVYKNLSRIKELADSANKII